jgi:uncharacterized RDD family membrane protein YckC
MSKQRIEYELAPLLLRFVALIIDVLVGVVLIVIGYIGIAMEYELIWKSFGLFDESTFMPMAILFGIVGFGAYYIITSGLTDGQTLGKMLMGIRVVTDSNESTKREFKLHAKRLVFLRKGTKVVKEKDPEVKGL